LRQPVKQVFLSQKYSKYKETPIKYTGYTIKVEDEKDCTSNRLFTSLRRFIYRSAFFFDRTIKFQSFTSRLIS
jgi:hypothetical protein